MGDFDARIEGSAISSLVALQQSIDGPVLVLCGLRYGILLCLELRLEAGLLDVTFDDIYKLGSTSVHIFEENMFSTDAKASSALVLCQAEMCRVTLHRNASMV